MYFELIFVFDVRKHSNFILFACGYLVILAPFIDKTFLTLLLFCEDSSDHICKYFFLDSQFYSIDLYVSPYGSIIFYWLLLLSSKF